MKNLLILSTLLFTATIATAQTTPSFGVRAGLSAATIRGDAAASLNNLIDVADGIITTTGNAGFFGGAYVAIPVSEKVSIEPALYYTQKGYTLQGNYALKNAEFLGVDASARLTTHYVDLPLMVKADFNGLQLFAGPQVSYLANANLRTTAGLLGFNLLNETFDATNQFNQWDAALTGGVGYQFANGLNLNAAYEHGLSRVDAGKSVNAYNRSVKVGLGITF